MIRGLERFCLSERLSPSLFPDTFMHTQIWEVLLQSTTFAVLCILGDLEEVTHSAQAELNGCWTHCSKDAYTVYECMETKVARINW